jgi:hypothetical protein
VTSTDSHSSERFSGYVLRAIAELGVNPKPLRGRFALAGSEYIHLTSSDGEARIDSCARRWRSFYQELC